MTVRVATTNGNHTFITPAGWGKKWGRFQPKARPWPLIALIMSIGFLSSCALPGLSIKDYDQEPHQYATSDDPR